MLLLILFVIALPCSPRLSAQGLSTSRIHSSMAAPLVIANTAPAGQPITFLAGASGMRALEIDGTGATWVRGPLSVGPLTGATANERLRVSSIDPLGGVGVVISLAGAVQGTGLLIRDGGTAGTDNASIVLQSIANGIGTGLRIGGPTTASRPSFLTGIDITGGTGLRYNALTAGSGTGIEIGGTNAPRRGIEVMSTGTDHIGIVSAANTAGVGIIGLSRSSAYADIPLAAGIGVRGHAATNSTTSADTIVGVMGSVQRGGTGGTATTSIGVIARAESAGTSHAGTAIGMLASANADAPGRKAAIGGLFTVQSGSLALATFGGDVLLGCSSDFRPLALDRSTANGLETRTTTHIYDVRISGIATIHRVALRSGAFTLAAGRNGVLNATSSSILKLVCPTADCSIGGLSEPIPDGIVIGVVLEGPITLIHDDVTTDATLRFQLPDAQDTPVAEGSSFTLWYDQEIERWRFLP